MSSIETEWMFFSNYVHVLVCLAQNPEALLRDVADRIGITERTAMRLINRLDEAGILKRVKRGRRNFYQIKINEHLRHPLEEHCTVNELLGMIMQPGENFTARQPAKEDSTAGSSGTTARLHAQSSQEISK